MKRSAIALAGAAVMLPVAAWCAEGGAEAAGGGSWATLGLYVINFALFILLIRWVDRRFGGATHSFFAGRARTIKETFARAEATLKEAQALADRARERMARLETDKAQLRADLDGETTYVVNRIRQMAREAAERTIRDTELTGGAMIEAAHRRVRELLAESTGRLARELLARSFTPDDQTRLLQSFQARLSEEARR
jgi:F0F1-type ATP synthase membrane subunit b/b'